ncbi:hypothetical protein MATL_G00213240 [Megalops atlanticus]|uniref:Uncharacterized protein n=1 Tax=Megalops atlanticus TaxID=7932 RepID=A0A9D3PKV8_MEGAT|nr:hypothetical protein MATL_G00213240 [Megalops atlanticus]
MGSGEVQGWQRVRRCAAVSCTVCHRSVCCVHQLSAASPGLHCLQRPPGRPDQHCVSTPRPRSQVLDAPPTGLSFQLPRPLALSSPSVGSDSVNLQGALSASRALQDSAVGTDSGGVTSPHGACGVTSASSACETQAVMGGQTAPRVSRLSENGQDTLEETVREELALVLTDREVKVLPRPEAQELSRQGGESVQTLTLPVQPLDGASELHSPRELRMSSAPLILLFREPLQLSETYGHLEALLEEDSEEGAFGLRDLADPNISGGKLATSIGGLEPQKAPTCSGPGPRIKLPRGHLELLREAVRRGTETGQRTLAIPLTAEMESVVADRADNMELSSWQAGEALLKPSTQAPSEQSQARTGQLKRSKTEDIRNSTYRRLDSLEETIRQLESALQEIAAHPSMVPTDHRHQTGPDTNPSGSVTTPALAKEKPPVPPKPSSIAPSPSKSGASPSGKPLHSAASRLKHLQQSSPEKSKMGKLREEPVKTQGQQQQ